jgi:hypothetical protein
MSQDLTRVTVVRNMVKDLRVAWGEIAITTAAEGRPAEGVNIAG